MSRPVKTLPDGRAMVNLGSSARVAPGWNNIDFSWILYFSRRRRLAAALHKIGLISKPRYQRILAVDPDAIVWNLSRGIPFPDETFDVVYHSHLLEHIDREGAPGFLQECLRVLKPGGLIRIVVPDLEFLTRRYLGILDRNPDRAQWEEYAFAVNEIFDQMVRREPADRKNKRWIVRVLEKMIVGDNDKAGVLHRWMYDRFSLRRLLSDTGFEDVQAQTDATSRIDGWRAFNLDTEPDGACYKPGSLYMEARRPTKR
jgi:SAM-dependent methyltransferase